VSLVSVLAEISASFDALLADDRVLPPDDQVNDLYLLAEVRGKFEALEARRAAQAWDTDATVEVCGRPVKRMLNEELCVALPEAARRLRHGRLLQESPALAGDLGREQVLLIGKASRQVDPQLRPVVEQELVELGKDVPPEELRLAVNEVIDRVADDEAKRKAYERRYAERGIACAETFGGFGSLSGTLTPETRAKLRAYLDLAGQKVGPEDERTLRQRHHDALDTLLDRGLAGIEDETPDAPPTAVVTVTIDARQLMSLAASHEAVATLGADLPITAENARRIACDARIIPVVLGGDRQILDVGRARRGFTRGCRHAALVRDQHRCAFPRCRRSPKRFHHIKHWAHGGPSDLDNCAPLCEFHHWLVHEGGWSMSRQPGGYAWTGPAGQQVRTPRDTEAA
jgi:hypothetical protein